MAMKPNLDQGNVAAKRKNMPGPLAKTKRTNLVVSKTAAKSANSNMKFPPNREGQTYRKNPSSTAPRMSSDDDRIRNELMTGKRNNSHSRSR